MNSPSSAKASTELPGNGISLRTVLLAEHVLVNLQVGFCHIGERDLKDPSFHFNLHSVLGNPQEFPFKLPAILE